MITKAMNDKAHKIIARYARDAWIKNKKRPGYFIDERANHLVRALGEGDKETVGYMVLFHSTEGYLPEIA